MGRPTIAFMLLALAGCGEDRRSFNDKYQNTEEQLEVKARTLEANLTSDLPRSDRAGDVGGTQRPAPR
ncbi:hypothetical protein OMW55_04240 [Sphingomonas sp. BN140010]|uniref:Lipoprotein n=1 Tax=Sphingomonas arvum TaxID=2992113 RepID=A0ABT3JD68_9SPHN|nr:hypothetical protein [Sphingomonas sp. BN140010]MCW3797013.1 hypothetical protein [Sphingomonas sp. BN140010]